MDGMRLPSSRSDRRQRGGAPLPAGERTEEGSDGSTLTLSREDAPAPAIVRPRTRAEREPLGRVDRWLSLGAVVASVAALVVLAGLPSPDGGVSTAVRGLVLLAFWLAAP